MKILCNLAILMLPTLFNPVLAAPLTIELPLPQLKGTGSLQQALQSRRSIRRYSKAPLTLDEVAQLAWAAQGITSQRGYRTAPSAGALYPLELYLVATRVSGLKPGLYHYLPAQHALQQLSSTTPQSNLASAAYSQHALTEAAAVFVITGVQQRTARKYGKRAERYVYIEAGHAGQNLLLQATELGLASVIIGAFVDKNVTQVLELERGEQPISLLAVGRGEE